jgi:hypothetical protein
MRNEICERCPNEDTEKCETCRKPINLKGTTQRLIYTVDIDEEFSDLTGFFELPEAITEDELGCKVIRSKFETPEEIISKGGWETADGEDE